MIDQAGESLTFDEAGIKNFLDSQAKPNSHMWGEGNLADSASYAYMAPGAGGLKTRTPGEYKPTAPRTEKDPKPQKYTTNEFIHPSVRYRMGLMKEKPTKLGSIPGRIWGQSPIEKYEPAALKGFVPSVPNDEFHNLQWKKPAQKKGEEDIIIREYQIPPKWGNFGVERDGVERRMVPSKIMKELDETNNYGETGLLKEPHESPQRGFQGTRS
jgi:hypothetical protein